MGSIGAGELILIFLVILLVFGAKRIPEIARGLGKGIREFKDATREISRELTVDTDAHPRRQPDYNTISRSASIGTPAPVTESPQPAVSANNPPAGQS